MVSEPLPKIDRFGTPHASVNYSEELDDNASLTIRSVGFVIHVKAKTTAKAVANGCMLDIMS